MREVEKNGCKAMILMGLPGSGKTKYALGILEDFLVIERTISRKGRNTITINDKNITLTELRDLGMLLGDIHEQHDTQKLLDEKTALLMVDELGKTNNLLNEYVISRYNYLEKKDKYDDALKRTSETNELLDELKFMLDELTKAKLIKGEKEELNETILTLKNQKEFYLLISFYY